MNSSLNGATGKTYLGAAIFVAVFVFFPTGIFAVKYSLEAKKLYRDRRFSEARTAANTSRKIIASSLSIAGIMYAVAVLGVLVYLIFCK